MTKAVWLIAKTFEILEVGLAFRKALSRIVSGRTMNLQKTGMMIAKPRETTTGLTTVMATKVSPPRFEITWTMIRPMTSSIMAELVKTTPRRVAERPLVPRIVNVVPRLVEHKAAPAAKDCNEVALSMGITAKERPIGRTIPVVATMDERPRLALRDLKDVDRPPRTKIRITVYASRGLHLPSKTRRMSPRYPSCTIASSTSRESHFAPGVPQAMPSAIWPIRPQ